MDTTKSHNQNSAEDELPSLLWGLDPVFSAYARLYIKDILQMRESRQVPGIYFYKTHPLFQVDMLGTVVYRREREDFYCYGVDDSTGVINCLCWKDKKWRDHGDAVKATGRAAGGGFNVEDQLRKLQEEQRSSSLLEIGDLLRVRGYLKTSRDQREIMASSFYKVNDPVMEVQISRMLEMPQLYKDCYNKPFHVPSSELNAGNTDTGGPSNFQSLLGQSVHILKEFLKEKEVSRFRPYDVEYLLHPLIQRSVPDTSVHEESNSAGPAISTQIRNLLKETLKLLQGEGEIFRKVLSQDEVYNVTEQDKNLLAAICDVLREDCKKEKYAEKGCHVLHILSSVRQRYSQNLSKEALEVALKFLECNSDIISTMDSHYTVL
ncbi:CST complex subunit STN1 [Trichomycterus rosablanca]|uniref:CST complex subunit STN1 n=1 Tax=Trichomycterus rosablanca TaxID=2290929 RepID=UPI002F3524EF